MELYFLDRAFGRLTAPVDTAISVVWSLRYFECGTFRAVFPLDPVLLAAARAASYLSTGADENGYARCGRIEYIGYTGDNRMEVSGPMLECLTGDRVMQSPYSVSGQVSDAVWTAVRDNLRGLSLALGADSAVIPEAVTLSCEWEPLSDWLYRTLRPYGASFTVTLDAERGQPVFRIVMPGTEPSVIFSGSFENIAEVSYEYSDSERKNAVYVEGYDGTVAEASVSDGGDRREIYRKAGDIRPGQFVSHAAYTEALVHRGQTILSGYQTEEYLSCTADSSAEPVFGRDYTLGDPCYVDDAETGISLKTRVTEADEVWENGVKTVYPGFGGRMPGIRNRLKQA